MESDSTDTNEMESDPSLFNISTDPEDDRQFSKILYHKEISIVPSGGSPKKSDSPITNSCWNCGKDDHSLRECKETHDAKAINKNRFNFQRSRPQKTISNEFKRYHVEIEDQFSCAQPGVISDKLREALGINQNQLPFHIYNMRWLGYPPGWLEEAKVGNSGISMLDSKGERVPDRDEEEGEIFVERLRYDLTKIIDYPGYNVWPPPDTINETARYNAPPMCIEHSKSEFINSLKKMMEHSDAKMNKKTKELDEMELKDLEGEINISGQLSFTALGQNSSPLLPPGIDSEEEGEINDQPPRKRSRANSSPCKEVNEGSGTIPSTPETSHGAVKTIEFGTPTLKIHSRYTALPPPESFQKDISDVEFFENLPNSTGKYEQLKGVLQLVRSKLTSIRDPKPRSSQ